MILSEFDNAKDAVLNPSDCVEKIDGFPEIGVTCFSNQLLEKLARNFDSEIIATLDNANGKHPIYKINYKGLDIALFTSRVGAPACVGGFEELIVKGIKKLIMFGTCGVLDKSINDLAIIIPTSAIRDEGTSYHYMKASDEVSINENYQEEFIELLQNLNLTYVTGKTWTTDAIFRETASKIVKRKEQGAICVEMECASMSAVAKFRGVELFHFLYAADNLDSDKWDNRSLSCSDNLDQKEKIALVALEFATKIF